MQALCSELRDEYEELAGLVAALTPDQWRQTTAFYGWTPFDEISHLLYFDERGLLAATDAEGFAQDAKAIVAAMAAGKEISALARDCYGKLDGATLTRRWRDCFGRLIDRLAALDPKARLPWYGPPMSARSFATARMMEVWAHGQDIYDLLGRRRTPTARLKHIAHIGVGAFGWTFVNRKLPVPAVTPHVALTAPDGSLWTWGEASATDCVNGSAEDFCLVVTQRRNVVDTDLHCVGSAAGWLAIAQCFAGPPANPPAPGTRRTA